MASELYVETLKGLTSGANANKVIIPSGQTLYAPGHVIQVVQTSITTEESFTSTSFTATANSVSITPSSASSKILVTAVVPIQTPASGLITYTLYRDTTNLGDASTGFGRFYDSSRDINAVMTYLDSPATTSAITYAVYMKITENTGYSNISGARSSIIVQEIAG